MVRHDLLADALSSIKNAERDGKKECFTKASKLVKNVLKVLQSHDYIGPYEYIEDGRGGLFKIELKGKIIDCNVIKPRFSVKLDEYEKFEKRFLPARKIGILIVSTSKGVMDHRKAQGKHLGGKLLAYCY
ncbi:MAG: 30S ribosomal protein S8 [Candidatus Aenigmatarchaeota archaeon]